MMPRVSVIMNCYNGEKYLKEAIDSVYQQSFTDWEIIFWDNASTDSSAEIARSFDHKLRYHKGTVNVPLGAARRLAASKATGEWLAFLDVDDYWFPNKLDRQLDAVDGTDYVMCYAGVHEIRPDGKIIRSLVPKYDSGHQLAQHLDQFDINMVTPIVSRWAMEAFNINFDDNIVASEEYNLFIRLSAKGQFCTVREVLGVWRIHEESFTQKSAAFWWQDRVYTLNQLKNENPDLPRSYDVHIRRALSRSTYYRVRWLMIENRGGEARQLMRSISTESALYLVLYAATFCRRIWNFLHDEKIKRVLSATVLGLSKRAP